MLAALRLFSVVYFQWVVGGWLGIVVQDLTPQLAFRHGILIKEGVFVSRVQFDSPAKKGGLIEGDVITSVNNQKVPDSEILRQVISQISSGTTIRIDIIRNQEKKKIEVILGSPPRSAV